MDKIRGTSFGNWLVLEKWMSPQLFQGTEANDEIWLNRDLPHDELVRRMKHHRDTYITEEDFKIIRRHNLNKVRIPVPYFIFGDRPPLLGCIDYLDKAFDWAEKYDLQILIDLHTAPGSQNGYDNGGLTGVCKWSKTPEEVAFVLTVLERLAQRYANRPGLFGIEVLNEPISYLVYKTAPSTGRARDKKEAEGSGYVPFSFLKTFYRNAYQVIRKHLPEDKVIVFSDAFRLGKWKDYFEKNGMQNVMLDMHNYLYAMETFIPFPALWIYKLFVGLSKREIRHASKHTPVIVGEWCIECRRPYHIARKRGKSEAEREAIRQKEYQAIASMQINAWETSAGWFFWNYQMYRDKFAPIVGDGQNDTHGASMDGWALNRCWEHGWWPEADNRPERKTT